MTDLDRLKEEAELACSTDRPSEVSVWAYSALATRLKATEELIAALVEALEERTTCEGRRTCPRCNEIGDNALAKHTAYREEYPADE